MPTEKRLGGIPRTNVGGVHTDAEKKAAASKEATPETPKAAKKEAEKADAQAGNVPVVEKSYEKGSPTEEIAAGRTNERRPVTVPEAGSEGIFKTEVEARRFHDKLARADAQGGQGGGDHDQDYQAYYFSAAETLIREVELAVSRYEQSLAVDPADLTFTELNIAPQEARDVVDGLRHAVKSMRKSVTAGKWESPVDQHSRINPQDRYDRNIVE